LLENDLVRLAALIQLHRDELLSRWRQQLRKLASARHLDTPTLNDHIPQFLDELVATLQTGSDEDIPEALSEGSPPAHGQQRFEDGFDIVEVVAEYNILRGCIHELADSNGLSLRRLPFHVVNKVLDGAIGLAVKTFAEQSELELQQRREEYLAFVAHDLRTPLSAASMATSVLEVKFPDLAATPVIAQMLKTLRRSVKQLETLVGKVLEENTHLQADAGVKLQRRELDLWPLVEALGQDLEPVAKLSRTRLLNEVPDELVVFADASLLRRILQNLMENAIRYTPDGEVRIGARDLGEHGVECWVSDNGAGIPADFMDKVFEKGQTDRADSGGTGLGLAIVKTFVDAHAGTVTVESTQGAGATFRFVLPAKAGVAKRAAGPDARDAST